MAASRDIEIYQGDTYSHEVRISDSDGDRINISGRVYSAQIRKIKTAESVLVSFTTEITEAANGVMNFSLSAAQTSDLPLGVFYYDLQEVNGVHVLTLMAGKATVKKEVTRV
jgi:hypothetical protein